MSFTPLTPEQIQKEVIKSSMEAITARIWKEIDGRIEDITCFSINRAAGMLDMNTDACRRLLIKHGIVDAGQRVLRVTVTQMRELIEALTCKGVRKKRKPKLEDTTPILPGI